MQLSSIGRLWIKKSIDIRKIFICSCTNPCLYAYDLWISVQRWLHVWLKFCVRCCSFFPSVQRVHFVKNVSKIILLFLLLPVFRSSLSVQNKALLLFLNIFILSFIVAYTSYVVWTCVRLPDKCFLTFYLVQWASSSG